MKTFIVYLLYSHINQTEGIHRCVRIHANSFELVDGGIYRFIAGSIVAEFRLDFVIGVAEEAALQD